MQWRCNNLVQSCQVVREFTEFRPGSFDGNETNITSVINITADNFP